MATPEKQSVSAPLAKGYSQPDPIIQVGDVGGAVSDISLDNSNRIIVTKTNPAGGSPVQTSYNIIQSLINVRLGLTAASSVIIQAEGDILTAAKTAFNEGAGGDVKRVNELNQGAMLKYDLSGLAMDEYVHPWFACPSGETSGSGELVVTDAGEYEDGVWDKVSIPTHPEWDVRVSKIPYKKGEGVGADNNTKIYFVKFYAYS